MQGKQACFVRYDKDVTEIYQDLTDFKLDTARHKLTVYARRNPCNYAALHLENYLDFFELFVYEDQVRFDILERNKKKRLALIEKNLSKDTPYYRFLKAEILLQWAITRAKFDQFFVAGRELYGAYLLLEKNQREFPEFLLNNKSLSIIHSLIETVEVPGLVKKLFRLNGSIEKGVKEIESLIAALNEGHIFYGEAEAIKAYILFFQARQQESALEFIKNSSLDHKTSLPAAFLKAKIAQKAGYNDLAISILHNAPSSSSYSDFPHLNFMQGMCHLRALDPQCSNYFNAYLDAFEGKHFIKEAYQKLAWARLVFYQDTMGYRQLIALAGTQGESILEGDKQAMQESRQTGLPNIPLLKARLLFDGGYYEKGLSFLLPFGKNADFIRNHGLEYHYRLGRLYHAVGDLRSAKLHYLKTTVLDRSGKTYECCNAYLQLAYIHEDQRKDKDADRYFRLCLDSDPETYQRSLHQKAKSGLDRLIK